MEGPHGSRPPVVAAVLKGRNHNTTSPLRDDDGENGDEGNVDGCPEALLPGALTRRLSACRLRLTLPPSLPPSPPSYPRLASSSGSSPCALWPRRFSTTLSQRSLARSSASVFPSLSLTIVLLRTFERRHGLYRNITALGGPIRIILSRTHFPCVAFATRDEITT